MARHLLLNYMTLLHFLSATKLETPAPNVHSITDVSWSLLVLGRVSVAAPATAAAAEAAAMAPQTTSLPLRMYIWSLSGRHLPTLRPGCLTTIHPAGHFTCKTAVSFGQFDCAPSVALRRVVLRSDALAPEVRSLFKEKSHKNE